MTGTVGPSSARSSTVIGSGWKTDAMQLDDAEGGHAEVAPTLLFLAVRSVG